MALTRMGFKDLPIAKKLTLFCMTTSMISLLIAMTSVIFYDRLTFENVLKDELVVLASIISNRSSAAVVFNDMELAKNNLKSLNFRTSIISACIYKIENSALGRNTTTRLASYPNADFYCPNYTPVDTLLVDLSGSAFVEVVEPIVLDGSIIGYLYLKSNKEALQNRQANHLTVLLVVSIFAFFIAFWLANIFARWISGPLLALGETARVIADEDDYSIRAHKHSNDEVGQVVESFNHMLAVIEREDANLRESEEKFRLISASSKVGIFQLEINGNCIYANDELSSITGLTNKHILAENWLTTIHPDDMSVFTVKWNTMLKDNLAIDINCRLKNGETKWISGYVGPLRSGDHDIIGYLGTINDISDVKNAQIQLEQLAFYDTLTGLANRRLFRNRLEHVINNLSREGSCLGLILLDLDQFKKRQ